VGIPQSWSFKLLEIKIYNRFSTLLNRLRCWVTDCKSPVVHLPDITRSESGTHYVMFLVGFELSHSIQKDRKPIVNLYFSSVTIILVLFGEIGIPPVTQTHYMRFGVKSTSLHSTQEGRKPIVNFKFKPPEWPKGVSSGSYQIDHLMGASTLKEPIQKPVRSVVKSELTN
jgi:hypothetical protein